MRVNVAVLLFAVVFAATVCRAQDDLGSHNFETINIALGAVVPVGEAYDGLWSVQPGVTGRVATEFYGGIAHLAVGVFDNKKWAMTIYRVAYRHDKTADKIRAAGLPAPLADRLALGR